MVSRILLPIFIVLLIISVILAISPGKAELVDPNAKATAVLPQATATELKKEDLTVGTGEEVKSGDTVSVQYKGTLLDGTEFDSSYKRNEPFTTKIGVGEVIKGWDQGIIGMKVGGKRKLTIPASLAYGEVGSPPAIPPNSPLIFEVEVVEIQ